MPLERRLTLRLDDERYRRVSAAARVRRTSLAAVIRDAIDAALPSDRARRQAAAALLAAEPMPVPATVEELKAELAEIRAGAED
jgi:predicted transcriptional regulator